MEEVRIPEFEDEEREARWWAANPDLILARFESALSEGRLGQGSARRGDRGDSAKVAPST
jgi:hypothetical protein